MSDITLNASDGIAHLQLNRPAVLNALSPDLLTELIVQCGKLESDTSIRVVVFEGNGKHFCTGADLPQFAEGLQTDPHGTADIGRQAKEALAALPQITIAAIKGYCIGGGLVLAGACDMRIAAEVSRFSIPEVDAGIPLSWGGMADVVQLFGQAVANDLVLTCRPFDARDALRMSFISRIFPTQDFDTEVAALAGLIAAKSGIVLRQTKRKLKSIRAGTFDARDDAAEMVEALNDEKTALIFREYLHKVLHK